MPEYYFPGGGYDPRDINVPFTGYVPGIGEKEAVSGAYGPRYYYQTQADRARIAGYLANDELLRVCTHREMASDAAPKARLPEEENWVPIDFFGMLARLSRHYTFGPEFEIQGRPATAPADAAVRRIARENNLTELLAQCAESATALGDVVLRVDVEDREDEETGETGPQALIRYVHPCHYFPEFEPLDVTRVRSVTLAWVVPVSGSDFAVIREIHVPGEVRFAANRWTSTGLGPALPDLLAQYGLEEGPHATGIDEIPVVHYGHQQRAGRHWGLSEFDRVRRIIFALENRISQEDEVLEKHSRPKLIVGPGLLGEDGKARLADFDVIEMDPSLIERAFKPEYLTWALQVEGMKHEIEKLEEYLFMTTETSPASFGLERDGSQVESARALRFKAHRTVNKIQDARVAWESRLRALFRIAQKREIEAGADYARGPIRIWWPDPILEDDVQEVQDYVSRKAAGIVSRVRAIRDLDGLSQPEAEAEVQEILQDMVDESSAAAPRPSGLVEPPRTGLGPVQAGTDVEEEEAEETVTPSAEV